MVSDDHKVEPELVVKDHTNDGPVLSRSICFWKLGYGCNLSHHQKHPTKKSPPKVKSVRQKDKVQIQTYPFWVSSH
jgi:hypothetical protein